MYNIGVDLSSSGAVAITKDNMIIDVLKYPTAIYDKKQEIFLKTKIQFYEKQEKSKTKIQKLKAELKSLKRRAERDYKLIYDFILPYSDKINNCVLEEPLRQMSGFATSVDSIASNFTTLGVYKSIFSILRIPYKLYLPTQWHKFFNYDNDIIGKLTSKERREKIKELSIKYCRDLFINADDFIILPRHKNPDDNIAEAILLSKVDINID